jgi:hypothetical protein
VSSSTSTEITDSAERDELRLLYQTSASDIAFFKQQQFTITNYALTLQAGIVFVAYQVLKPPFAAFAFWSLLVLACAISFAGILVVSRLTVSISARRTRLERIREHFGPVFRAVWSVPKEPDDFHWLLRAVLLVSAAISVWLIVVRA